MPIAKEDVVAILSHIVVPQILKLLMSAVGMPVPIPLDDLVDRAAGNLAGLDGAYLAISFNPTHHFHSEGGMGKLWQVTVAIGLEAVFHPMQVVAFV